MSIDGYMLPHFAFSRKIISTPNEAVRTLDLSLEIRNPSKHLV